MSAPAAAGDTSTCGGLEEKKATLWMLIRIILVYRSPTSSPCPLKSTPSPILEYYPISSPPMAAVLCLPLAQVFDYYVPVAGVMTTEPPGMDVEEVTSTEPKQAYLLKRVPSEGSSGSARDSAGTPKVSPAPLSPGSGGARTPRAFKAILREENLLSPGPTATKELASDMHQLKVQSSPQGQEVNLLPEGATGMTEVMTRTSPLNGHDRASSSSTDSSSSTNNHPHISPHFGSVYGSDGFPLNNSQASSISEDSNFAPMSQEQPMSAQAAAVVAAADEAIMKLNGTASVFHGPLGPGIPADDDPYQLPRGFANFVKPQARADPAQPGVSRQSSTSSSTTEASTSSEESDLCIPSIEWVNTTNNNVISPSTGFFPHTPYATSPGAVAQKGAGGRSPGKMPPPALTGRTVASPRRPANVHILADPFSHLPSPNRPPTLALGAPAHTPSGLRSSALPGDVKPDAPDIDEDDDATVGHARERSPSTSSQSAQSGFDLLWAAAAARRTEAKRTPPFDPSYDGKGKRKAGADAVAQWRTSGIPSGIDPHTGRPSRVPLTDSTLENAGNGGSEMPPPPLKKRRRSEMQMDMEIIDPALRDLVPDGEVAEMLVDDGSDFEFESGDVPEDADDSEYGSGKTGRTKTASGRGRGSGKRGGAKGRISGGTAGTSGTPGKGTGGSKKSKKDGSPNHGGGNGGGSGGARRGSASGPLVGVQCEYINPLPPYNRCTDIFTRKYDLPRHMARHARREGELVVEGKLAEEKALLWRTIKDKPKVTCGSCGESFTRMDALKRHQTKQHHS